MMRLKKSRVLLFHQPRKEEIKAFQKMNGKRNVVMKKRENKKKEKEESVRHLSSSVLLRLRLVLVIIL